MGQRSPRVWESLDQWAIMVVISAALPEDSGCLGSCALEVGGIILGNSKEP